MDQKTALLIVDVQVGVMEDLWESDRIVASIQNLIVKARARNAPIIWVQHEEDEGLVRGSEVWKIVPDLTPASEDSRIYKKFNSSFEDTALDETLRQLKVNHIVLAGAASNWCIRATAYGALCRGYNLTMAADAHTTADMDFENGGSVSAEQIINELNTVMNWVGYPGVKSRSFPSTEISFV